ncbi:MAG: hypothetical protein IPP25_15900 [Saprospiraceae bacterium]|nr:hypothetical protein [Candidatus Opimibacter skivensis]
MVYLIGQRPLLVSSPTTTRIPAGGGDTRPAASCGCPRPAAVVGVLTNNHENPRWWWGHQASGIMWVSSPTTTELHPAATFSRVS